MGWLADGLSPAALGAALGGVTDILVPPQASSTYLA